MAKLDSVAPVLASTSLGLAALAVVQVAKFDRQVDWPAAITQPVVDSVSDPAGALATQIWFVWFQVDPVAQLAVTVLDANWVLPSISLNTVCGWAAQTST